MRAEAAAVAAPPVALDLDLDVFDGPFDLLVTLILRDEIDIWEVRVSRIIAEYVVQAGRQRRVRPGRHLAVRRARGGAARDEVAAAPRGGRGGGARGPRPGRGRRALLERLVRYSQFKNVAGALCADAGTSTPARLYRNAPVPAALLRRPAPEAALPAQTLPAALAPLLREPPVPDTSHLTDLAVTLVKELRRLRVLLADDGRVHLRRGRAAGPPRARRHVLRAARAALQRRGAAAPDAALRRHRRDARAASRRRVRGLRRDGG